MPPVNDINADAEDAIADSIFVDSFFTFLETALP